MSNHRAVGMFERKLFVCMVHDLSVIDSVYNSIPGLTIQRSLVVTFIYILISTAHTIILLGDVQSYTK